MKTTPPSPVVPDPAWERPAKTWAEVIDRYVRFVQVPALRVMIRRDGGERSTCLSAGEAETLGTRMRRAIEGLARRRRVKANGLLAEKDHLVEFSRLSGRQIPRADRCSDELQWHLRLAFLLNASGYTCAYCRRTVWGVYAEDTPPNARTLRFQIDHRTARRRLDDRETLDMDNFVAACRSCNTIKAELTEDRFLRELESLASAFLRSRGSGPRGMI